MIIVNPNNHDLTAKTLLNYPGRRRRTFPLHGLYGRGDHDYANASLNQALDNIF
jgi:hypothetical protein